MNISLAPKSKKGKTNNATTLGFGLNSRKKKRPTAVQNVFGADDEDDDESLEGDMGSSSTKRSRVNRQILKEQEALRLRAQVAASSVDVNSNMYDYDGAYDSFNNAKDIPSSGTSSAKDSGEERKSRYIGDLLQAAKKRERERDAIYERKVAKEQALEEAQDEYAGKEKFITKAYRKRLEERQQWEAEEEARQKQEDAEDVTKKTAPGTAMASFYGNFSRNVAMGGIVGENLEELDKNINDDEDKSDLQNSRTLDGGLSFLSGFEKSEDPGEQNAAASNAEEKMIKVVPEVSALTKEPVITMRERRERKIAQARIRYLERKKQQELQ